MLSAIASLAAGLIVGIGYGLCGIRSPAPPAIALLGLLGMLAGERGVLLAPRLMSGLIHPNPPAHASVSLSDHRMSKLPGE